MLGGEQDGSVSVNKLGEFGNVVNMCLDTSSDILTIENDELVAVGLISRSYTAIVGTFVLASSVVGIKMSTEKKKIKNIKYHEQRFIIEV